MAALCPEAGAIKAPLAEALLGSTASAAERVWRIIGFGFILAVVLTWVLQSEVAQLVETTNYNRPYLITYLNHSAMMLLAPVQGAFLLLSGSKDKPWSRLSRQPGRLAMFALLLALVYQAADWVWYLGLTSTSVGDATIVFNSMSAFVFVLEWMGGRHRMDLWKALAVTVSFVGVSFIEHRPGANLAAGSGDRGCMDRVAGNLCVLFAAFLYAVYQVCIDRIVQSQDVTAANTIVALQGLVTFVLMWPGAILLSGLPATSCLAERLSWPPADVAGPLAATVGMAFAFNVFFCLAITTTTPLLTSAGCMLTVPVSLLADLLLHGDPLGPERLLGSGLVAAGFLMLALPASDGDRAAASNGSSPKQRQP